MIVQGLNALVQFVAKFFDILKALFVWCLDGCLYVLKGGLYFGFDGILTVIEGFVQAIQFGFLATSMAASWSGVSPQLIYVINACGIPAGLGIIGAAIGVRMTLNLIPAAFTRI